MPFTWFHSKKQIYTCYEGLQSTLKYVTSTTWWMILSEWIVGMDTSVGIAFVLYLAIFHYPLWGLNRIMDWRAEGGICNNNMMKTSSCLYSHSISIFLLIHHSLCLCVLCGGSLYTCIHSFTHLTRTTLIEGGGERADSISGDRIGFDGEA